MALLKKKQKIWIFKTYDRHRKRFIGSEFGYRSHATFKKPFDLIKKMENFDGLTIPTLRTFYEVRSLFGSHSVGTSSLLWHKNISQFLTNLEKCTYEETMNVCKGFLVSHKKA